MKKRFLSIVLILSIILSFNTIISFAGTLEEDDVINENNINVSEIKKGNWNVFKQYISNLPTLK